MDKIQEFRNTLARLIEHVEAGRGLFEFPGNEMVDDLNAAARRAGFGFDIVTRDAVRPGVVASTCVRMDAAGNQAIVADDSHDDHREAAGATGRALGRWLTAVPAAADDDAPGDIEYRGQAAILLHTFDDHAQHTVGRPVWIGPAAEAEAVRDRLDRHLRIGPGAFGAEPQDELAAFESGGFDRGVWRGLVAAYAQLMDSVDGPEPTRRPELLAWRAARRAEGAGEAEPAKPFSSERLAARLRQFAHALHEYINGSENTASDSLGLYPPVQQGDPLHRLGAEIQRHYPCGRFPSDPQRAWCEMLKESRKGGENYAGDGALELAEWATGEAGQLERVAGEKQPQAVPRGVQSKPMNNGQRQAVVEQFINERKAAGDPVESITRDRVAEATSVSTGWISENSEAWEKLNEEKRRAKSKPFPTTAPKHLGEKDQNNVADAIESGELDDDEVDWDAVLREQADDEANPNRHK